MFKIGDEHAIHPWVLAKNGMVSAGQYLATAAGLNVLTKGGNAVDAGVAAGLCLNTVHCDMNTFSGVAPIIIYLAERKEVVSLAGIGWWPKAVTPEIFTGERSGLIQQWPWHNVVPAAADAWLTALRDYGTMSFAKVVQTALHFAETGFPVHRFMRVTISHFLENYQEWSPNRELFLENGSLPSIGKVIRLPGLAHTFRRLIEVEQSAMGLGREAALTKVRDYFYKGDIARDLVKMNQEAGGLMTEKDFASYEVKKEPVYHLNFRGYDVYTCGPWCQGPVLLQALNILKEFDLQSLSHNSPAYVHLVAEALKLAFSDREGYYGDPAFVDVPLNELLSPEYGQTRAGLIDPERAWSELPPCGELSVGCQWHPSDSAFGTTDPEQDEWGRQARQGPIQAPSDTSYVAVIDRQGNMFSATPSDGYCNGPIHPTWGLHISERGQQTQLDPKHPNYLSPGKRPRLTPSPALVLKNGHPFMAFGTPGNDRQPQAMLQFLLNVLEFDMPPQQAVVQPRLASFSFPASTSPHVYLPGVLRVEENMPEETIVESQRRGHQVELWPALHWVAGGVCAVVRDVDTGVLWGAADPRREGSALGI